MTEKFEQLIGPYTEKMSIFEHHEPLRVITDEDGHETYQMSYHGKNIYDEDMNGWMIVCECDLTEGVGWEIREVDGKQRRYTPGGRDCKRKLAAGQVRIAELRDLYNDMPVKRVLLDLLKSAVEDEVWIGETNNGATFWGGGYYLQTAAEICGYEPWSREVQDVARELAREGKIFLEGMVVCYPRQPTQREVWSIRLDKRYDVKVIEYVEGSSGSASLEIYDGDEQIHSEPTSLSYGAVFGPDIDDVERWKARAVEVVDNEPKT